MRPLQRLVPLFRRSTASPNLTISSTSPWTCSCGAALIPPPQVWPNSGDVCSVRRGACCVLTHCECVMNQCVPYSSGTMERLHSLFKKAWGRMSRRPATFTQELLHKIIVLQHCEWEVSCTRPPPPPFLCESPPRLGLAFGTGCGVCWSPRACFCCCLCADRGCAPCVPSPTAHHTVKVEDNPCIGG